MEIAARKLKTRDAQQFFFKNNNGNFSYYTDAIWMQHSAARKGVV